MPIATAYSYLPLLMQTYDFSQYTVFMIFMYSVIKVYTMANFYNKKFTTKIQKIVASKQGGAISTYITYTLLQSLDVFRE